MDEATLLDVLKSEWTLDPPEPEPHPCNAPTIPERSALLIRYSGERIQHYQGTLYCDPVARLILLVPDLVTAVQALRVVLKDEGLVFSSQDQRAIEFTDKLLAKVEALFAPKQPPPDPKAEPAPSAVVEAEAKEQTQAA